MPSILEHHHVLAVPDVRRSAQFYVDALGFAITHDSGGWIFVARDGCTMMLGECPDDVPASDLGSHRYVAYLRVDDAAAFHAGLQAAGVTPLAEPADKPWGMREFAITTPDGHRMMIGQTIRSVGAG